MCIRVLNQDSAYDFYVDKLGFRVHTDAPLVKDVLWLTVCAPIQPELKIALFSVGEGDIFTKSTVGTMAELIKKTFGAAVIYML